MGLCFVVVACVCPRSTSTRQLAIGGTRVCCWGWMDTRRANCRLARDWITAHPGYRLYVLNELYAVGYSDAVLGRLSELEESPEGETVSFFCRVRARAWGCSKGKTIPNTATPLRFGHNSSHGILTSCCRFPARVERRVPWCVWPGGLMAVGCRGGCVHLLWVCATCGRKGRWIASPRLPSSFAVHLEHHVLVEWECFGGWHDCVCVCVWGC